MLEAKRPEDLQAAAAPIMFQAMLMSSLVQESAKPKPMSAPAEGIMLTIGRELSDDEQTKLLTRLEALSDDPAASSYTATATGGKTLMSIKPVKNVTLVSIVSLSDEKALSATSARTSLCVAVY